MIKASKQYIGAIIATALILSSFGVYANTVDNFGYSDLNSTTTPLGSGETFTGTFEQHPDPDVMVSLKTDNTGTVFFDFSVDGVNSDSTFPVEGFQVAAGINEFHTAVKGGRYFRVRLVNDTGAQTYLRLGTYYGKYQQGNLPLSAAIAKDADARVVRSVSSQIDLAFGRLGGFESGTKFGRNPDVDTGTPEDMWNGGETYTGHPVSFTPETVDIFSSDAADTSAGTGARTIRIFGLKTSASTAYESEDITMNGTSAVTSVNTWWRVNRAYALTAGSGGTNAGTITVRSTTTTANVFAQLPIGFGQTTIGAYTVPADRSILIKRVRAAITRASNGVASATFTLRVREPGGVYRAVRAFELSNSNGVDYTEFAGQVYPAGSDIKWRIDAVANSDTVADAAFEYILVDQ